MRRQSVLMAACAAMLSMAFLCGCGEKASIVGLPNQNPTVRLTAAPPTYAATDRYFYSVTLNWTAYDPDGRVDHYMIAVIDLALDPAKRDTLLSRDSLDVLSSAPKWIRTARSDTTIRFNSTFSRPAEQGGATLPSDDAHIFLIKAVDNRGAESVVERRAFFSSTLAPTVEIDSPKPSKQTKSFVTPAVLIRWHGDDADGVLTKKPVQYKYILLNDQTAVTLATALLYPDSVRRYYAPRFWADWDSTSGDTTVVQYTNLIPSKEYMFVIIAFDEAGAYSPVFERDKNMLLMRVTFAGNNNPTITMFNEFFSYTYPGGSYEPLNPARVVQLELPAGVPVTFNWFATPDEGSIMRSYRWALDIQDLNDNTARTDQQTDLAHWSPKNLNTVSATLPAFQGGNQTRTFYLEAEDINGLKSLGMIGFLVIQPTFDKPLLVVKDWRLPVDRKTLASQTCTDKPTLRWPMSAELDTFLFARGGFPWKCIDPVRPPALTSPGVFKGFEYDTVGTRIARVDQTVRLSKMSQYRHVVWIEDQVGAANRGEGTSQAPMSALNYMAGPNRANTLATYVRQGGKVWMAGGGGMEATLWWYNNPRNQDNDHSQPAPSRTYSFDNNELIPGRFMYDIAKWQSETKFTQGTIDITRQLGRNQNDPFYADLPARFDYHSEADGDTFPPNRGIIAQNFYYDINHIEYLSRPNGYLEDLNPDPVAENLVSGLDTLYQAAGIALVQTNVPNTTNFNNVCMTVYPARSLGWANQAQVIFSGFDIWSWRKTQCRELIHFVLNKMWELRDDYVPPTPVAGQAAPARNVATPAVTTPARGSIRDQRPVRSGEAVRAPRTSVKTSGRSE